MCKTLSPSITIRINPIEYLPQPFFYRGNSFGKSIIGALKFINYWFHVEIKISILVCNFQNGRLICK